MAKNKPAESELSPSQLTSLATAVAARMADPSESFNEAETILRTIATENREPDFDERKRLWQLMQWDDRALSAQLRRMRSVVKHEAIAGTGEDRDRLAAEAQKSKADLFEHGDRLRREIEEREAQLRSLESAARQSAKRFEEAEAALQELTNLVPEHIVAEQRLINKHSAKAYRERMQYLQNELKFREYCKSGQPADRHEASHWFDKMRNLHPELVLPKRDEHGGRDRRYGYEINPTVWGEIRRQWDDELPKLEAELAQLEAENARAKADIAELSRYYWR